MAKTLRQYIEQLEQIAAEYGNDIPVVCRDSYGLPFTYRDALKPKVIQKKTKPKVVINLTTKRKNKRLRWYSHFL